MANVQAQSGKCVKMSIIYHKYHWAATSADGNLSTIQQSEAAVQIDAHLTINVWLLNSTFFALHRDSAEIITFIVINVYHIYYYDN